MSPLAHALLAWLVAAGMVKHLRDRRLVVLAGILSDIDGVFVLFDRELFDTYHHTFGHSFVLGIPLVLGLALLAKNRKSTALAAFTAFTVHVVSDIIATNWAVYPFYPFSDLHMTIGDHVTDGVIYGTIDPTIFLLALLLIVVVGYTKEISPVEFFWKKLDQKMVSMYVYPFKYRCEVCGKWAFIRCDVCGGKVCSRHIESLLKRNNRFSGFFFFNQWRCYECAKEGLHPGHSSQF